MPAQATVSRTTKKRALIRQLKASLLRLAADDPAALVLVQALIEKLTERSRRRRR